MTLTINIVKGLQKPDLQIHQDYKIHVLRGSTVTQTGVTPLYGTPTGPWDRPISQSSYQFPSGADYPYKGFMDIRIGYLGPDKRKRRGLYAYSSAERKMLTWNNFYKQEYKGLTELPDYGYRVGLNTCGFPGWRGYYGGNAAAIHASYLPRSELKPEHYGPTRGDWEWSPKFPDAIAAKDEVLRMIDYTLQLNHRVHFYEALEKLRSADVGLALAEGKETTQLLITIAKVLTECIMPLKKAVHGDPVALLQAFAGVSSLWLTWSYGIKPLIQDFRKLVEDINDGMFSDLSDTKLHTVGFDAGMKNSQKEVEIVYGKRGYVAKDHLLQHSTWGVCRPNGVSATFGVDFAFVKRDGCKSNKVREVLDDSWRRYTSAEVDYASYTPSYEISCSLKRRAKHEYVVRYQPQFTLTQLGLNNPALIAWELTPLSLVVDWTVKVSEFLANRNSTVGLEFLHSLHSIEEEWKVRDPLGHTSECLRFFRVTGDETDGSYIKSPSSYLYVGSTGFGNAIPKASVEWGTGVDVEKELSGGRETNAAALLTVFASLAVQLRVAKTEALIALRNGQLSPRQASKLRTILVNL